MLENEKKLILKKQPEVLYVWVVFFNGTGRVSQSVSQSYTQREACASKNKQLSGLVVTWDYPGAGRFF